MSQVMKVRVEIRPTRHGWRGVLVNTMGRSVDRSFWRPTKTWAFRAADAHRRYSYWLA